MEIDIRTKGQTVILDLAGRLDVNAAELVEVVGQCLREGYRDILCNFEDLEFIDYMGISAAVLAYKEVMNHHGRMKFCQIATHLREIFVITGIDRAIEIYASEELALNSFAEDKAIAEIKKMQLRRRFRRLPIELKIELKDKYQKTPECLRLDIVNLSAIGAYIYGCDKFRLSDEVVLKFSLPPGNEELELEGRVVWLADKQVQPHLYPGMAVEFRNLPSALQNKLAEFVERNLSLMPPYE
jgi:anti-anti-sigma factor